MQGLRRNLLPILVGAFLVGGILPAASRADSLPRGTPEAQGIASADLLSLVDALDAHDAWAVTASSDYPDALVQLAALAATPRAGDLVVSAARTWDLRSRWEPIAHRSTHGALHREHMLVPLVTNHPVAHRPRRTVDVMPSALTVLGVPRPNGLDGRSFC